MSMIKHYPDVLDCIANLSNDEVFTPPTLVNKVLDLLPIEVWSNPNLKWLDPACKTGVFLREIAKRLWLGLADKIKNDEERKEHIFKNMLYGIAITELTFLSSKRSLYYSKDANSDNSVFQFDNINGNIFYENIQHTFENNTCKFCGISKESLRNRSKENHELHAYNFIHEDINKIFGEKKMKFDVIVGNPPYQVKDGEGGGGSSSKPLYHLFIEEALKLNPQYLSMIIPARWYSGGKGLDTFRKTMLNDKRISHLYDFSNPSDCFPGVKIEGGVCYFLLNNSYSGECEIFEQTKDKVSYSKRDLNQFDDVFVRYNNAIPILNKILSRNLKNIKDNVMSRKPFGLSSNFTNYNKKPTEDKQCKIFTINGEGYIDKKIIENGKSYIDKHKVLVGKAYGYNGNFPHQISNIPFYSPPNSVCTETYLIIGMFDSKQECDNFISYYKTKLFRFLLLLRKPTQNISKDCFSFIPQLDMKKSWSDKELYKEFDLTQDDIDFIESMIKPI